VDPQQAGNKAWFVAVGRQLCAPTCAKNCPVYIVQKIMALASLALVHQPPASTVGTI
jgi:hypothetical protein